MKTDIIKFRVATNKRDSYKAKAKSCKLSLSAWVIRTLEKELGNSPIKEISQPKDLPAYRRQVAPGALLKE